MKVDGKVPRPAAPKADAAQAPVPQAAPTGTSAAPRRDDQFQVAPEMAALAAAPGYAKVPADIAIKESITIRGPGAELPTPAEVAAIESQGKDVLFSNSALREAHALGDHADEFAKREHVQGVVLSIDDYATKDLDNAMSFRREADGTMVVGIHAVDLSAWVKTGSTLDFSARKRKETQYLDEVSLVLPMLPLSLSEGKLSLFENEARLTKSVEMRFSPDGTLLGSRIFKSQLVNRHRLDEGDAAQAAKGEGRGAQSPELKDALASMATLAAKAQGKDGALAMDKMLGFFTTQSTKLVGQALSNAGYETSFRNQPQANGKSSYGAEATGHASIGAKAYATWTGPMRRYADLDVHRSLDRLIDGRTLSERGQGIDSRMRAVELDRQNKVTQDSRMDWVQQVVDVTRTPAGE